MTLRLGDLAPDFEAHNRWTDPIPPMDRRQLGGEVCVGYRPVQRCAEHAQLRRNPK
jgi:hypothetical protein